MSLKDSCPNSMGSLSEKPRNNVAKESEIKERQNVLSIKIGHGVKEW